MVITQQELRKQVYYNPETGIFVWRVDKHNNTSIGDEIGTIDKRTNITYLHIRIQYIGYNAHRLAWLYIYGAWPEYIDHINGNGTDNRLSNLRNVSNQENCKNSRRNKTNTSGFTGVCFVKVSQKWSAYIKVNYKKIHLGSFVTKDEAIKVRKLANLKYGFHENHGQVRA